MRGIIRGLDVDGSMVEDAAGHMIASIGGVPFDFDAVAAAFAAGPFLLGGGLALSRFIAEST